MKRLYKSRKDKIFDGVCGGTAEFFNTDPVLVRIIFVLFTLIGGSGIIAYIVGMIIMPVKPIEEGETEKDDKKEKSDAKAVKASGEPARTVSPSSGSLFIGIILILIGGIFLMDNFPFINIHPFFWLRRHFWEYFIPGILIVTGIIMLVKSGDNKTKEKD
jgi:phage shock protein C